MIAPSPLRPGGGATMSAVAPAASAACEISMQAPVPA
jgi:hypothetical protein